MKLTGNHFGLLFSLWREACVPTIQPLLLLAWSYLEIATMGWRRGDVRWFEFSASLFSYFLIAVRLIFLIKFRLAQRALSSTIELIVSVTYWWFIIEEKTDAWLISDLNFYEVKIWYHPNIFEGLGNERGEKANVGIREDSLLSSLSLCDTVRILLRTQIQAGYRLSLVNGCCCYSKETIVISALTVFSRTDCTGLINWSDS